MPARAFRPINPRPFTPTLEAALMEDAPRGDITSIATITEGRRCVATLTAKEDAVMAGLPLFAATFRVVDMRCRIELHAADGERVKKGAKLATVTGPARSVLTGERVALNFLQRLSGVATLTAKYVERVKGTGCVILDTRKTTPLMRDLEKYAVTAGGGENHRRDLSDAILIKENHIVAAGGIAEAVARARASVGRRGFIEVETETLAEVRQALEAGVSRLLLDNMTPAMVKKAVAMVAGEAETEASGNMSLTTVARYAKAGVGYISVGSLTHSAPAADLSLRVEL